MSERVLCSARAAVLLYDEAQKLWVPAGGVPGAGGAPQSPPSCVQLFQQPGSLAFRLLGRRLGPEQQVVLNCPLARGLRYSQATPQFHQWSLGLQAEQGTPLAWPDPDGSAPPEQPDRPVMDEPERRGTGGAGGGPGGVSGFAAAIAGAKLRKVAKDEPPSGGVAGAGGGAAPPPAPPPKAELPPRRGLMEEMSAMLARRRKATEAPKKEDDVTTEEAEPGERRAGPAPEPVRRPWEKSSSTLPRMKSAVPAPPEPHSELDLERFKLELLEEFRRELHKMKEEIIQALLMELRKPNRP
ncbi:vasodilator-stimulated phosphoprotein [Camarhynchus parvulus]|uniref:vasodilator-stimulated phosphoprotein n=1 Tax=Geospiza parvula TaxID=87175 RepID=UPI00123836FD|nr:vasodilator-stimulated phosphoprotein [Camarhynchus parvulus]